MPSVSENTRQAPCRDELLEVILGTRRVVRSTLSETGQAASTRVERGAAMGILTESLFKALLKCPWSRLGIDRV